MRRCSFTIFLLAYVVILILHSLALPWYSWQVPIGVGVGLIVAGVSHWYSGRVTILLLLVHMGLEWTYWAQHGWHYSARELCFHGIHAVLDVLFLKHELERHAKAHRYKLLIGMGIGLAVLCTPFYQAAPQNPYFVAMIQQTTHSHSGPLDPVIIGGMIGCIVWHLRDSALRNRPTTAH